MSANLVDVSVTGLDAIHAQLMELKVETAVKVLVASARKAFMPVLWAAKGLVPVDSGALRDAMTVTAVKNSEGDTIVTVGIRIGHGKGGKPGEMAPASRWHFIELGTIKIPAHPYLRPALDTNAAGVVDVLKDELVKRIAAAVKRASRGR